MLSRQRHTEVTVSSIASPGGGVPVAARHARHGVTANVFRGSVGNLIEWYDWYVYAAFSIYVASPVLLVTARLLQGLSLGGEYGTSATYLSEVATPRRRGYYSSFQYVTLTAGQLVALGVQVVLQRTVSAGAMHSWGWRVPFVIGAFGAVSVLWLRRTMDESTQFDEVRQATGAARELGSLRALMRHPRAV